MISSAERIQYIADYLSNYEMKIRHLNRCGLYDSAVLFELFAQEICGLYFGQTFVNLNKGKANFPCVDLVSEDQSIYVQVSTQTDVNAKIKDTLQKIRKGKEEGKDPAFAGIHSLYFFALTAQDGIIFRDYTGNDRIGDIDFLAGENLITPQTILEKAKTDLSFQEELYRVLRKESADFSTSEEEFQKAVKNSRLFLETGIEARINDEYVIDRTDLINRIRKDTPQFFSIQGAAGSGKSALCKMLLQDESIVLAARAETVASVRTADEIWGLDIETVLRNLNGEKIVFYIDALEFIADGPRSGQDALFQLYETAKQYDNAYIVTSCRTYDKEPFRKLEGRYQIKCYGIPELDESEIAAIANRYPIIGNLSAKPEYASFLHSPLYLNLIVTNLQDLSDASDVNAFRSLVWKQVICLGNKALPAGVRTDDVREAVEKLVLERAQKFLPGVPVEDVGETMAGLLLSNGILRVCGNGRVRLKYDVFEDICFERMIDRQYGACRGDKGEFFSALEHMGTCVYRRYQIWVQNKLFSKSARADYLFDILTTDHISEDWKQQTITGIVKSASCAAFFEEYGDWITENCLDSFLAVTNRFAFQAEAVNLKFGNVYTLLRPAGHGRACLIQLVYSREKYKIRDNRDEIVRLCTDYSKTGNFDSKTGAEASDILLYYFRETERYHKESKGFHSTDELNSLLEPIYRLAEYSKDFIRGLWQTAIDRYLQGSHTDEDLLEFALKNTTPALALYMADELCHMATVYWTVDSQENHLPFPVDRLSRSEAAAYGLSKQAQDISYRFKTPDQNRFFLFLTTLNFPCALDWTISLTNRAALALQKNRPEEVTTITLALNDLQEEKNFLATEDFWQAGTDNCRLPELITDAVYLLTCEAVSAIRGTTDAGKRAKFAESIKKNVFQDSNNIIILILLAEIGKQCRDILPGYALELLTDVDLLLYDVHRTVLLKPNAERERMENNILKAVGIPFLSDRYSFPPESGMSLQEYAIVMQAGGGDMQSRVEKVLDYLYSRYPDDPEHGLYTLQIQKMDLRNADIIEKGKGEFQISPIIHGEAKKYQESVQDSPVLSVQEDLAALYDQAAQLLAKKPLPVDECLKLIAATQTGMKKAFVKLQFQELLILLIATSMKASDLTKSDRSRLCNIWIDGVIDILHGGAFHYDEALSPMLFMQIEQDIDSATRDRLYALMLELLTYDEDNGRIEDVALQLKGYLPKNKALAKEIFNELVKTKGSEEEKSGKDNTNESFQPPVEITAAINCGLNLDDKEFTCAIHELYLRLTTTVAEKESGRYSRLSPESNAALYNLRTFLVRQLMEEEYSQDAVDFLFDIPDVSALTDRGEKFFREIGSDLFVRYFDAWQMPIIRRRIEKVIIACEQKIIAISDWNIRTSLTGMLFLSLQLYTTDLNNLKTAFFPTDKLFLNDIWSRYGSDHLESLIEIVYQLHLQELLPDVLIPLYRSFSAVQENVPFLREAAAQTSQVLNMIISKAYQDFCDPIRENKELSDAYIGLLQILVSINFTEAAVLLDDFRVH